MSFPVLREQISLTLTPEWSERLSAVIFLGVGCLIIRLLTTFTES
jgi:hypothetical protein